MKKANCLYKTVLMKDVASVSSSLDPLASARLPIGVNLIAQKNLVWVPASGSLTKDWQAVMLVDPRTDEAYFVSPRVFLGLGFNSKKFVPLSERIFPKIALIDFLATEPTIVVAEYHDTLQDVYGSDPLEQDTKAMPRINWIKAEAGAEAPKAPKVPKVPKVN